jgi:CDP-diacylglycerol--glycerol-3-phosphate 3-phosphatidyltransferase
MLGEMPNNIQAGRTKLGIYVTKSKWQKAIQPIVDFCVRKRIHPDLFTYGALLLSFVAGGAFILAGQNVLWLWLVAPCVLLRLLFNLLDGQIARSLNLADKWGFVKNEFGDRVADIVIFLGLAFSRYANARLAALCLALILCVSYIGILGKALPGPRIYGGIFGKGDRMISLALFTFYPLFSAQLESYNFYLGFGIIAAVITIIQRLRIIYGHS